MSNLLIFADLDGTLFRSRRRIADSAPLIPRALSKEGRPQGYRTPLEEALYAALFRHAEIVPVTGRDERELAAVMLPPSRWKALLFGAVIYTEDGPDLAWKDRSLAIMARSRAALEKMRGEAAFCSLKADLCLAWGEPCAMVCRTKDKARMPGRLMETLRGLAADLGLSAFGFGGDRKRPAYGLLCLPKGLGKREAVRYLRAKRPGVPAIGIGDQASDFGFLSECDLAAFPPHAELAGILDGYVRSATAL